MLGWVYHLLLTLALSDLLTQTEEVDLLARARHHLLGLNSSLDLNFVRLQATESPSPDPFLSRLLTRGMYNSTTRVITALEVLHFKPIGTFRDGKK